VALPLFLLFAQFPALSGQQTSVLRGNIRGPDGEPIAGVSVAVTGGRIMALTDARGGYELTGIPAGPQRIEVERLGYRGVQLELEFRTGRPQILDLTLEVHPIAADSLEVAATIGRSPQLRGFYNRLERGLGYFVTEEAIERMQVRQVTDVLRRVPGLIMQPVSGPFGTGYVVQMGRTTGAAGARPCPVLFYVNGMPFPVTMDIGIDNFVRPDEVAGIEVYSGTSNTPSQFAANHPNARCGVIVIWTHSGRRSDG